MMETKSIVNNQQYFNDFTDARPPHSNYYETGLSMEIIEEFLVGMRLTVGTLLSMMPREVLEQ